MAGQSRKWMIVVATTWIQAFTGTNLDFSAYSSALKESLGISQVALNYLATASDLGKALGWSSGLALLYLPLPAVLLAAAAIGLSSYALQWLLITSRISLPYLPVFMLCLLAGCSICWFNTVCFVLCIRNFSGNRSLALSLSVSFNGVSAALYALFANALSTSSSHSPSIYLILNAVLPLAASVAALPPILRQPPESLLLPQPLATAARDTRIFLVLYIVAFVTGIYLLLLSSLTTTATVTWAILAGAMLLLALPLVIPGVVIARDWAHRTIYSGLHIDVPDAAVPCSHGCGQGGDDLGLWKPLISSVQSGSVNGTAADAAAEQQQMRWLASCCGAIEKERLAVLGEEHSARKLIRRIDFWLYYVAYFCGATVGLVYSNNLGQIAQSLHRQSELTALLTVYSSCSFFGRLLSAIPDFLRRRLSFARTGWLAAALVPMPVAFFMLARLHDEYTLLVGTALVGLSSGFIFAAAVSVTSELFGPNSVGVNHNILITNIPLGSLLYGQIAALVYDANGQEMTVVDSNTLMQDTMVVCMGTRCYGTTFFVWGCITLVGLLSSIALFLRTRPAYAQSESRQVPTDGD